jgi:hypothetical protein
MAAGDPGVLKRNFSATAIQTSLVNSISSAATGDTTTSVAVISVSGFPSTVPYTLILDPDGSKEEVVTVTAASSTTLTITRGQDNTPAVAHSAGTSVRHGVSGRDFKEEQTHIAARGYDVDSGILSNAGQTHVHGLQTGDGSVVGADQVATLTRKTLTTPVINGATLTGTVSSTASIVVSGAGTITGLSSAGMVASSATPKNYVDAILGSATAAATSATSAATSATSAATSATSAAASASASASSASAAATSASSALTSQTAAATSATSAAASATAAATSATSAAASATTASNSAATATTQAANAATSATSAATSATSASASATAAASSAGTAATSAGQAATSATSAATSATSAAASATAAATSATSAAASATTASNSAATATTQASNAATSASSALTSQTAAATSATSAAASATAAATSATSAAASATAAATSATSAAASATAAAGYVVPSQTGNAGKFLGTNGTAVSWNGAVSSDGGSTITVASGTTVPLTIQNNGTGNSFVVNDVASDTSPFTIASDGKVSIGDTTNNSGFTFTPESLLISTNTAAGNSLVIRKSFDGGNSANILLAKSRGSNATQTAVQQGDIIGNVIFSGFDGTNYILNANILSEVDSAVSTGVVSGVLKFNTTNTSGSPIERMRITSAGLVGIGGAPGAMLQINNNAAGNTALTVIGAAAQTANVVQFQDSGNTPSFAVSSLNRVGVGTGTPAAKLHTVVTSGYSVGAGWDSTSSVVATGGTTNSGGIGISYDDTTGGQISSIIPGTSWKPVTINADSVRLNYAGTVAGVVLNASGNVGVGTASPTAKLDVNGSINSDNLSSINPILNSSYNVWQRGTTISLGASSSPANSYLADRWQTTTSTNQASTISRVATGDTTNLPNIQYAMRYQRNSGQTGQGEMGFYQSLETIDSIPFVGKQVTFSFYARKGALFSGASNALYMTMYYGTGTDQSVFAYTNLTLVIDSAKTLTTTWQRFTATATVPSVATEIAVGGEWFPVGTAGATDYFEVTGMQLELGSVATPYRSNQPNYQAELAACQRYYWRSTANGNNNQVYGGGLSAGTTTIVAPFSLPVQMRTAPTVIGYANIYVTDETTNFTPSAVVANSRTSVNILQIQATVTGATASRPYLIVGNGTAGSFIDASAEL